MASGDIVDYEAVMVDEFDALNIEVRVSGGPSSSVPDAALSAPQCPGMRALPQKGPVLSTPVPTTAPPPTPLAVDNMVIQKETTKYPAKLHAAKVADELKASSGLVFLPGEPSRTYEYSDMGPAFHQRRYFFYLAGVNVPDCAVTYSLADDRLTVWIPHVEPRKVLYNGRVPSIKDVLAASDVDEEACIAAVAPGILYYSLHLKASAIALRGLLRLGILKGDEKAIWAAGTVAAFFPHGLGHHIGLETHDPGLYFNKDYIEGYFLREDRHRAFIDRDVLARYYPVGGVRIEDCILVTHDGHENLTDAPKGEDMLRIIRGEAP
ncbi:hypothetical protein VdG1_04883 [Verticillium dahliae VDG1]|nr:hypothetical protein VdG1_04883 [Verticillium dahliae VDG1]